MVLVIKKNTVLFYVYFFSGNDLGCALTQTLQVAGDQIFFEDDVLESLAKCVSSGQIIETQRRPLITPNGGLG